MPRGLPRSYLRGRADFRSDFGSGDRNRVPITSRAGCNGRAGAYMLVVCSGSRTVSYGGMVGWSSAAPAHGRSGLLLERVCWGMAPWRLTADPYQQLCAYWQYNTRSLVILPFLWLITGKSYATAPRRSPVFNRGGRVRCAESIARRGVRGLA